MRYGKVFEVVALSYNALGNLQSTHGRSYETD